ncbi:acyl-CoA dehydrogenase family protein [Streptomyces polygonati]|uniref:Acyl-CoA dehydrogenase family protein n=1 Tax=Streptomyces polygonati TaxID=1617087 RepID=A0ABV8HS35_9ACTN
MPHLDSGSTEKLRAETREWLRTHWRDDLTIGAWWGMLAEAGYAFPTWPVGWGGLGLRRSEARPVAEEIARAGAVGPPGGVGQMVGGPILIEYGTPEQRRRWLPALAAGAESWCQLFSEPGAGSDLASLQLRAERHGERWLLNGQKLWAREAEGAERGLALARTDSSVPKREGITLFVVDLDQPGVEVRPIRQMNGRASFNEVFLTDVAVTPDRVVGEIGGGWPLALASVSYERAEVGGAGVLRPTRIAAPGHRAGGLDRKIRELTERARADERREPAVRKPRTPAALIALALEVGRSTDPLVRQRLAAVHAMAEADRLRNLRLRSARRQGRKPGPEVSLGKLVGSEVGRRARDIGLSVLGAEGMLTGAGTTGGGAFQQMALSVQSLSIAGGTDEIQRNLVGERVLGLPREPEADRDVPFHHLRVGTQQE